MVLCCETNMFPTENIPISPSITRETFLREIDAEIGIYFYVKSYVDWSCTFRIAKKATGKYYPGEGLQNKQQ